MERGVSVCREHEDEYSNMSSMAELHLLASGSAALYVAECRMTGSDEKPLDHAALRATVAAALAIKILVEMRP